MRNSKSQMGFSIIEFLVAMAVLTILFAAVMSLFVPLLKSTKTERGISQSQIEGVVGLEMLRTDIVHSGHGLAWNLTWNLTPLAYNEVAGSELASAVALNDATTNPPRAISTVNNASANTPDYLAIKASNVGLEDVSQKVSYIQAGNGNGNYKIWGDASRDFAGTDYVALIRLVDPATGIPLSLVQGPTAGSFVMQAGQVPQPAGASFANEIYYIYGLSTTTPRMPFNRADYHISYDSAIVPSRCAAGTGTLVKSVVSQADGTLTGNYPILDCVADFQIAYGVDTDTTPDGTIDCATNDIANIGTLDVTAPNIARTIRDRVREVRVYILAQEGEYDLTYRFNNFDGGTKMRVGEDNSVGAGGISCASADDLLGQDYDLSSVTNFRNYRWKLYRFTVHPENLTYSLIGAAQGAK